MKLKEDLHDLAIVTERREESSISLTEMKQRLKRMGETDDGPSEALVIQEPPLNEEGDEIARAALRRMRGVIPITDPELARWLAESPEL